MGHKVAYNQIDKRILREEEKKSWTIIPNFTGLLFIFSSLGVRKMGHESGDFGSAYSCANSLHDSRRLPSSTLDSHAPSPGWLIALRQQPR